MEEQIKVIYNLGYGSEYDHDRLESVVRKDDFLNRVVWRFINTPIKLKNVVGKDIKESLVEANPFICRFLNGKIIYIKSIRCLGRKAEDEFVEQAIEKYGFTYCMPIGMTKSADEFYEIIPEYDSISLWDFAYCIELTKCDMNGQVVCETEDRKFVLWFNEQHWKDLDDAIRRNL